MAFPSVYEMTNPLTTVRKQHFWEYFSGSKLQDTSASPSFTDNFSSSTGWTSNYNTNSGVVGGELIGLTNSSGTNGDGVWKDYGLIFDDNKFVLRCKFQIVTQSGNAGNASTLYFGLSDTNGATSPHSARDGFGIAITNYAVSGMLWNYPDGATWDNADTDLSLVPTATTYYLEFKRTSATSVTFTLYSDSGFSSVVRTHTQSISSNLNGLRYLMMQGWRNGSSNTTKVAVSNLELYNGVSNTDDVGIRWTLEQAIGASGNTGAMVDSVDGGYAITPAGVLDAGAITFNGIRQYSYNSSVCIAVCNKIDVGGRYRVGLSADKTLATTFNDTAHCFDGASGNIYLQTANGTAGNDTASDVTANTTNVHGIKIETKSSSVELSIDGVFKVVNTTYLPLTKLQPVFLARGGGGAGNQKSAIRYMEAYNT
jgi:hypothetical protein